MKRIVAIDDSIEIRELIEFIFQDDYEVKTMDSFKRNYKIIIDFNPDIILIDCNLDDEDGIEMVKFAKKDFENVKFFILTGSIENIEVLDKLKEKKIINDYFLKTYSPFEILNKINKVLEEDYV